MNVSGANDFIHVKNHGGRNLCSQDTFKAVLSLDFLVAVVVFCFFVLFCLVCRVFAKLFLLEKIFS